MPKPGRRPPAQLLVDDRDQLVSRAEISATPRVQQSGHVVVGTVQIAHKCGFDFGRGGFPSQGTQDECGGLVSTFPANARVSK